jgi:hypothetical protein
LIGFPFFFGKGKLSSNCSVLRKINRWLEGLIIILGEVGLPAVFYAAMSMLTLAREIDRS